MLSERDREYLLEIHRAARDSGNPFISPRRAAQLTNDDAERVERLLEQGYLLVTQEGVMLSANGVEAALGR